MPALTQEPSPITAKKTRIIEPDSKFRDDFGRNSFIFNHNLAGNSLFELPRLTKLAETLLKVEGPTALRWKNSDSPVDAKWAQRPPSEQIANVSEAIQNLDKSGSWVVLYRVQNDPEYSALLDQALAEMEEMMGRPLISEITWKDSYIFMASPFATTPYHIDHETACLMQVHGDRIAQLWDQRDRSILTEEEIEQYYLGDIGSANFNETKLKKAITYKMNAGTGVHHPTLAPHSYKNGDTYSVAIGVHLCLKDIDRLARAYQVNGFLRKMRFKPTPPGINPSRDRLKISAMSLLDKKKPKNKYELIRSGAARVRDSIHFVGKLGRR